MVKYDSYTGAYEDGFNAGWNAALKVGDDKLSELKGMIQEYFALDENPDEVLEMLQGNIEEVGASLRLKSKKEEQYVQNK